MRHWLLILLFLGLSPLRAFSQADAQRSFDHQHRAFNTLLSKYVHWNSVAVASSVDYAGLAAERAPLDAYTKSLSAVTAAQFAAWTQPEQLAFLINAYNAFTLELILSKYPELASIRDLGSWLTSPWKQRFFTLLGESRHLDDVEHGLIRGAKDYSDPRIHFAVNCASIGCPALRNEAFTAPALERQLEDQTRRFLRDRSRNQADPVQRRLALSNIFKWYGDDFARGFLGAANLSAFLARYSDALGLDAAQTADLRTGDWDIEYLDYDWRLNATPGRADQASSRKP